MHPGLKAVEGSRWMLRSLFTVLFGAAFGVALFLLSMVYSPDRVRPLLPDTISDNAPIVMGESPARRADIDRLTAELDTLKGRLEAQERQMAELREQGAEGPSVSLRSSSSEPSALVLARLDKLDAGVRQLETDLAALGEQAEPAGDAETSDAITTQLNELSRRVNRLSNSRIADLAYQLARHEQSLAEIRGALDLPAQPDASNNAR